MDPGLKRQKKYVTAQMLKALFRFSLIQDGDRVLVALSGGKDSSLLAYMLKDFSSWFEKGFYVEAINVKTDISCGDCMQEDRIRSFTEGINIPLHIERITLKDKLRDGQKPECFVCSWNRRKVIFKFATSRGFNRVAFGHHRDDFVETALLNLFFCGEFASMSPLQEMFGGRLHIIRPLIFIREKRVLAMMNDLGFEYYPCRCPFGENSKRNWVRKFLREAEVEAINLNSNIFRSALSKVETMEGGFTPKRRRRTGAGIPEKKLKS